MTKTTAMAMMRSTGMLVGLGVGFSLGCLTVRPNPDHCANLEGDRTCADRYPGERMYCTACGATPEDGCVAERPEDDTCYTPCGGRTPFEDDATCLADTSSSSGEESTSTGEETGTETGSSESSTTGPTPCVGNEDCPDAAAPFCEPVSGECVACDGTEDPDGACAGLDPMAPLCVGGACVACTPENPVVCEEQLLLCDGGTNSCVPCTEHGQCGSGACELAVGRCFPSDFVVRVDGDEVAMPPMLYETVADAVAAVEGTHGVIVVHELDGAAPYTESVIIDADKTIALLAAPGEAPVLQGTGGNPGISVEGAGTILYIDGLTVAGNTMGLGLRVDDAFAWVDRSRIVQNSGGGVRAENGAELVLRNCFVGGASADVDAIALDGSILEMAYTTVGGGSVIVTQTRALFCTNGATADARNSILLSLDPMPEIVCPGVMLTNSASEAEVGFDATWFNGYATGDFSLSASGATTFADIAVWQSGDPTTDLDGDPRPAIDGTPDYAGADVP